MGEEYLVIMRDSLAREEFRYYVVKGHNKQHAKKLAWAVLKRENWTIQGYHVHLCVPLRLIKR